MELSDAVRGRCDADEPHAHHLRRQVRPNVRARYPPPSPFPLPNALWWADSYAVGTVCVRVCWSRKIGLPMPEGNPDATESVAAVRHHRLDDDEADVELTALAGASGGGGSTATSTSDLDLGDANAQRAAAGVSPPANASPGRALPVDATPAVPCTWPHHRCDAASTLRGRVRMDVFVWACRRAGGCLQAPTAPSHVLGGLQH